MIKKAFSVFGRRWGALLKDPSYRISLFAGLVFLVGAYIVSILASSYHDSWVFVSVGDIILDNIPTYDMEVFFSEVMYGLVLLTFLYPVIFRPEIAPFAMKTFAMLTLLRSGFILLTNIGPPTDFYFNGIEMGTGLLSDPVFRNDLFFSGHTAYPFLAFLIYRKSIVAWILLFGSFLMAVTVLLMHVHYSIDVFSAFFIAYGVYNISDMVFNKLNLRFKNILKSSKVELDNEEKSLNAKKIPL